MTHYPQGLQCYCSQSLPTSCNTLVLPGYKWLKWIIINWNRCRKKKIYITLNLAAQKHVRAPTLIPVDLASQSISGSECQWKLHIFAVFNALPTPIIYLIWYVLFQLGYHTTWHTVIHHDLVQEELQRCMNFVNTAWKIQSFFSFFSTILTVV